MPNAVGFDFLHALHIRRPGGAMERATKSDWYVIGRLDDGTPFRLDYTSGATGWTCEKDLGQSLRRRILDRLRRDLRQARTLPDYCAHHDVTGRPREVHEDIVSAFMAQWRSLLPQEPVMLDLDVPFVEKDEAKALGARWNRYRRLWQAPQSESAKFAKWLPDTVSPTATQPDPDADLCLYVLETIESRASVHGAIPAAAFRRRSDAAALVERIVGAGWVDLDRTDGRAALTPQGREVKDKLRANTAGLDTLHGVQLLHPMHGTWLSWFAANGGYHASDLLGAQPRPTGFELHPFGHYALAGGMTHRKLAAPIEALYDGRERIALLHEGKSLAACGFYRSVADHGDEIVVQAGFERYCNDGIHYPIDSGHLALVGPAIALVDADIRRLRALRPGAEIRVKVVPLEGKLPSLMSRMLAEKLEALEHSLAQDVEPANTPAP